MRPKSYNTEKPSKKVCTGIFEDRDSEDTMVSFHDEASANETITEHSVSNNKQTEESTVSDNSCSKADYTELFDNLTADFNFGEMDEQVISEEKWNAMMFPHMTEQEELHNEKSQSYSDSDSPIYPGHSLTVQTSMILILLFSLCHGISGSELTNLLTLISLHCLHPHPGIRSAYMFKKFFADLKSPVTKHYYCSNCMLGVCETDTVCPNTSCQLNFTSTKTKGYFLEMPIESQLKNILEKKHTSSLLQQRFSRDKKDSDCISDIYDGNIYKSFSGPGGPLSEEFPYNVSFTWNTDGVPVFKSSKFSIWPFYLAINELPFKQRIQKENLLFCGLWFGESKPNMNLYSKPMIDSFRKLETEGIAININGNEHVSRVFLICGTADLPAKSLVMNCNQFNGAFSCMRCMDPGETFKTAKGGNVHIFPFDASKPVSQSRTGEGCLNDSIQATREKKVVNGIKGPSFLMTIQSYDYVKSSAIDYMHGVLLGVSKLLINLWIGSTYSKEKFSISSYVEIIDERLLQIKPPSFITRIPRTLSNHFKYWKASELRAWLFYYSLPILLDILPPELYIHYAAFVEGIYLLCTECVTQNDLRKSYQLLGYFVHMFPSLYGERYLTLNMHSLIHLPQCVADLGPLWVYSCFPFEDANGTLLELFHGTQNVEMQIISSINIVQSMPNLLSSVTGSKYKDFVERLQPNTRQWKGVSESILTSVPLGKGCDITLSQAVYAKLVSEIGFPPLNVLSYKRIRLNGSVLYSSTYSRVFMRNTFTVKYYDLESKKYKFGRICYFLLARKCGCKELCECESAVCAVMFEHVEVKKSIVGEHYLDIQVPHIKVTKKTNSLVVVNVDKITTAVVTVSFNGDEQIQYLCDVPNMMESD